MPAFPTSSYGAGTHFVPKLDHGNKAVATGAVPFLCPGVAACFVCRVRPRAERGQRAPAGSREPHRRARLRIVEGLNDVSSQALIPVDLAPGRLPGAEIRGQLV